jgi:hypothetical protein
MPVVEHVSGANWREGRERKRGSHKAQAVHSNLNTLMHTCTTNSAHRFVCATHHHTCGRVAGWSETVLPKIYTHDNFVSHWPLFCGVAFSDGPHGCDV